MLYSMYGLHVSQRSDNTAFDEEASICGTLAYCLQIAASPHFHFLLGVGVVNPTQVKYACSVYCFKCS